MLADRPEDVADVELRVSDEESTVGDLLRALGDADGATGVVLDGRFCHLDLALNEIGIYEGARVWVADGPGLVQPASAGALELRIVAGLDAGRWLALGDDGATVGRDAACELVLGDEGVSRHHVRVTPSGGGLRARVADLGSINGTWVEGKRIEQESQLAPGEVLEAGDVALMVAPPPRGLSVDPLRQSRRRRGRSPSTARPEPVPPDPGPALSAPEPPPDPERPRLSIVSAVGPLVLGVWCW